MDRAKVKKYMKSIYEPGFGNVALAEFAAEFFDLDLDRHYISLIAIAEQVISGE